MKTEDTRERADDNTGSFVSILVKNTDAALEQRPDDGTLEETMAKAIATARGKPAPPPAVVFTGHSLSLAGEFRAKADTIKSQADDLLGKIRAREAIRDAEIERIHNNANSELNQIEAEHADLIRSFDALVSAHETLTK